jgi:transcriptional regulator with XRE-family HTH domain
MEAIKRQAAQELGARLRIIRKSQKMSLQEVEIKSHGHWKAVVIGSYERADRALSVGKLAELLHFLPSANFFMFFDAKHRKSGNKRIDS